jgi:hypothetical protein
VAYQQNWAITLFPRCDLPGIDHWLDGLRVTLERDHVRIIEDPICSSKAVEFWVSTTPELSPARTLQRLKGRLQYAVRHECPRAFRRNYRLESVGSAQGDVIANYVARQPDRHPMADARTQRLVEQFQIRRDETDLSRMRQTAHGQFIHNLHLVLEHADGMTIVDPSFLRTTRDTVERISDKKGYLLSRGGIVANHLHLALGCPIDVAAVDVALSFLNNLTYAHGMKPIYRHSFYVGTFGNFDLGALRAGRQHPDAR